ncbi:hypothetical protein AB0B50_25095 [Streptomyces sp. NPDC041068]|uniref:GNAT family N-acetyltransferase n=1 Tax=Streptomyces sp. NPDC041068 TaxID=3155130 RepID=UPI0033DF5686
MTEGSAPRRIRPAVPDDADALQRIYEEDGQGDFATLLAQGGTPGTTHYVVEGEGRVVAAFTLTRLGRLRPDGAPRVFLHEIKLSPIHRGVGLTDDVFAWLRSDMGAGRDIEVLALTSEGQEPSCMAHFGLARSHNVFKWPITPTQEIP